jgi:hypothetical protein
MAETMKNILKLLFIICAITHLATVHLKAQFPPTAAKIQVGSQYFLCDATVPHWSDSSGNAGVYKDVTWYDQSWVVPGELSSHVVSAFLDPEDSNAIVIEFLTGMVYIPPDGFDLSWLGEYPFLVYRSVSEDGTIFGAWQEFDYYGDWMKVRPGGNSPTTWYLKVQVGNWIEIRYRHSWQPMYTQSTYFYATDQEPAAPIIEDCSNTMSTIQTSLLVDTPLAYYVIWDPREPAGDDELMDLDGNGLEMIEFEFATGQYVPIEFARPGCGQFCVWVSREQDGDAWINWTREECSDATSGEAQPQDATDIDEATEDILEQETLQTESLENIEEAITGNPIGANPAPSDFVPGDQSYITPQAGGLGSNPDGTGSWAALGDGEWTLQDPTFTDYVETGSDGTVYIPLLNAQLETENHSVDVSTLIPIGNKVEIIIKWFVMLITLITGINLVKWGVA